MLKTQLLTLLAAGITLAAAPAAHAQAAGGDWPSKPMQSKMNEAWPN